MAGPAALSEDESRGPERAQSAHRSLKEDRKPWATSTSTG
jgi:hypothetical protein